MLIEWALGFAQTIFIFLAGYCINSISKKVNKEDFDEFRHATNQEIKEIKEKFANALETTNTLIASMDKNIAVLIDRDRRA